MKPNKLIGYLLFSFLLVINTFNSFAANHTTVGVVSGSSTITTVSGNTETVNVANITTGINLTNSLEHIAITDDASHMVITRLVPDTNGNKKIELQLKNPTDATNTVLATTSFTSFGVASDVAIGPKDASGNFYAYVSHSTGISAVFVNGTTNTFPGPDYKVYDTEFGANSSNSTVVSTHFDKLMASKDGTWLYALTTYPPQNNQPNASDEWVILSFDPTMKNNAPFIVTYTGIDQNIAVDLGVTPTGNGVYFIFPTSESSMTIRPYSNSGTALTVGTAINLTGTPVFNSGLAVTVPTDINAIPTAAPRISILLNVAGSSKLTVIDTESRTIVSVPTCGFAQSGFFRISDAQANTQNILGVTGGGGVFIDVSTADINNIAPNCEQILNLPPTVVSSTTVPVVTGTSTGAAATTAVADFTPTIVDFCTVEAGTVATKSFDIVNGGSTLTISNYQLTDPSSTFTVDAATRSSCTNVAPNITCSISVSYNPLAIGGPHEAQITFDTNVLPKVSITLKGQAGAASLACPKNDPNPNNTISNGGNLNSSFGEGGGGTPQQVNDSGSIGWILLSMLSLLLLGRRFK